MSTHLSMFTVHLLDQLRTPSALDNLLTLTFVYFSVSCVFLSQ